MSREQRIKASGKIMLKNTRNGIVENNAVTGEIKRVSKREAELDLRGAKSEPITYSQVGNSSEKSRKRAQNQHYNKSNVGLQDANPEPKTYSQVGNSDDKSVNLSHNPSTDTNSSFRETTASITSEPEKPIVYQSNQEGNTQSVISDISNTPKSMHEPKSGYTPLKSNASNAYHQKQAGTFVTTAVTDFHNKHRQSSKYIDNYSPKVEKAADTPNIPADIDERKHKQSSKYNYNSPSPVKSIDLPPIKDSKYSSNIRTATTEKPTEQAVQTTPSSPLKFNSAKAVNAFDTDNHGRLNHAKDEKDESIPKPQTKKQKQNFHSEKAEKPTEQAVQPTPSSPLKSNSAKAVKAFDTDNHGKLNHAKDEFTPKPQTKKQKQNFYSEKAEKPTEQALQPTPSSPLKFNSAKAVKAFDTANHSRLNHAKDEFTPKSQTKKQKQNFHSEKAEKPTEQAVQPTPSSPLKFNSAKAVKAFDADNHGKLNHAKDESVPKSQNKKQKQNFHSEKSEKPTEQALQTAHVSLLKPDSDKTAKTLITDNHSRLKFDTDESAPKPQRKKRKHDFYYENAVNYDSVKAVETPKPKTAETSTSAKADSKNIYGKAEKQAERAATKVDKAQKQADRVVSKLERAKEKLPENKKAKKRSAKKHKLRFENELKPGRFNSTGLFPLPPVKSYGNVGVDIIHQKMSEVENENVATKAVHRAEMLTEKTARSALKFYKETPYRKVARLERRAVKKSINLTHKKMIAENPKMKSNPLSRLRQKRKIKKDYAKAVRNAKKSANNVKQAGTVVARASKAIVSAVTKNPAAVIVIALVLIILFVIVSFVGTFGNMWSSGLGGILSSVYVALDEDIDEAEILYTALEINLRTEINDIPDNYPNYDEYVFINIDSIGHDPYEIMAYLTAVYHDFTYSMVESDLQQIFDEQYDILLESTYEIKYSDIFDSNGDGDYGAYAWRILEVYLIAQPFGDVVTARMTESQITHYNLLMETKGGRHYVESPFAFNWLSYVTSIYGYRFHPITGEVDLHRGVDIALPTGIAIYSVQDGTVAYTDYSEDYGNVIVISNSDGITSKYAHCGSVFVSGGQTVSMGDIIATVGETGETIEPQLHLELLKDGQYLNPLYYVFYGY